SSSAATSSRRGSSSTTNSSRTMRRLLRSCLTALRLEGLRRGLLDVIAEGDGIVHPREDLARPTGPRHHQVAVVQQAAEQSLLDADGLHLAQQELRRVSRHDPDLEDESRRCDSELRREELDCMDPTPPEAAEDHDEAQVPDPLHAGEGTERDRE